MRQAQDIVSEAIIQQILYSFTFQHFHIWFVSFPTHAGGYRWGHSTLHAHNIHGQCLGGLGRGSYCALNIQRRNGTPTWCFCSIPCKLHYPLLCASMYVLCLYVHTHSGCQLVKTACGFMTPTAYLSAYESMWIMQIQRAKNVSIGSEQYDRSQVGGNKLFKECHVGEVREKASSTVS